MKRLGKVAWIMLVVVVIADLSARLITREDPEAELEPHPELLERLHRTRIVSKVMTVRAILERPDRYPAPRFRRGPDGMRAEGWTTFGALRDQDFPVTPPQEDASPGVVRIAFFGGSTTFDGYPQHAAELFAEELGDRVEVLNLGFPASNTTTTALLMKRFIPRWKPHIVVVYHGFNDLVYYRSRARALHLLATGARDLDVPVPIEPRGSRGLWALLTENDRVEAHPALEASVFLEPTSAYWDMQRAAWEGGWDLYVSTFASPHTAELAAADRAYYEADIRWLWPVLGSVTRYARDLEHYNARLRRFAHRSGASLIDVAPALDGGRAQFRDNCHRNDEGRRAHAQLVVQQLGPRVRELLALGAPTPVARPVAVRAEPSAVEPSVPTRSGRCTRGPCPAGACLVPEGEYRFGYDPSESAALLRNLHDAVGFSTPVWCEDDEPEASVHISAFCIDETEANESDVRECVRSSACPFNRFVYRGRTTQPAIVPTAVDAERYCAWRGGRLPTDAEWEAAARGDIAWTPWSPELGNYCGAECAFGSSAAPTDEHETTAPIGAYDYVSPFGLIDAAGNQWEWAADCFDTAVRARADGVRDPIAPPDELCRRFLRGGSYSSYPGILERRVGHGSFDIDIRSRGVRCAYDVGDATQHQVVVRDD